jgi:poly(A) polymerase/tRNA nucleotidyltransferase (CCA-adding enzyme)
MNQNYKDLFINIPKEVKLVVAMLSHAGHEAYLVGGCVRDHLMGIAPNDYDVTTNATPEQIIELFPRTFYENSYGTVGVVTAAESEQDQDIIKKSIVEVTPYRIEGVYSDNRHPDEVSWSKNLSDDLKRRDFTCNAMAYDPINDILVDLHDGLKDINSKTLRAVGDPDARFKEDALRMMRAIRFSAQLDFEIEEKTKNSIFINKKLLGNVSHERIRDEFCKVLMTKQPMGAIILAHNLEILEFIVPELEKGIGVNQNQAHSFDVWEHNLRTLQHAADKEWSLELRLSALFHDISKPETRRFSKEKKDYTFYGHDVVGGRVSHEIMTRLKFSKETIEYVSSMVRWHMFFSDTEKISLSAVRRLISNVGKDKIWDLMNLRVCDRVGTGRPKEQPYRFREYQSMIEQALQDPVTLKMLKIDGKRIMDVTQETPGRKIGYILHALFAEVLEDPVKNTSEYLEARALHMKTLDIKVLKSLAEEGKDDMENKNADQVASIRKSFHVK